MSSTYYELEEDICKEVKDLCLKKVPFWDTLTPDDLEVSVISSAVTNRVFKVTLLEKHRSTFPLSKLILKKQTSFNYLVSDPELQFKVATLLGDNKCGPKIVGRFGDYTIQQWVDGEMLENSSFHNLSVVAGVASTLAKFHKKGTEIALEEWDRTPFVLPRMTSWSQHLERIIKAYNLDYDPAELVSFLDVYKKALENHTKTSTSLANSVLFCHNDLFSLNILDFQHGIYFIDFDFSAFNYVGWEVASLFTEISIVYDVAEPPYFTSGEELRLSHELQSLFVSVYLSRLLERNVPPYDELVKDFLTSLEIHMLGVNLFWAYWGIIMTDRPVKELNKPIRFDAYSKLQYDLFKKQLQKLKDEKVVE